MRTLSNLCLGRRVLVLLTLVMSIVCFGMLPAQANAKYSGIVIDAKTGKTLYSYKADKARYPASLTKMMTMYMMFEALESGKLSKKTRIKVSRNAAAEVPSKLGIKAGRSIAAEHAIYALATKSANDVATAVAEHLGGSEAGFARMMTRKARKIGMSRTTFKNAHGLTAKGQLTTARDMARLGIALREHYPQYYKYFSTRNFKYGKANYRNHNRLLGQVKGVDGIKTGYTRASGFNLVSSVQASRRSIVAVVMGGRSGKSRNAQMRKLIATYLRKASKRKKKKMIAGVKSRSVFIASAKSVVLPKRGPVPEFRPGAVTVAAKTVDVSKPVQVAAIVPTAKVAANPAILRPAVDVTTTATVKPVVTRADVGSSAKPTGWVIQIAAADSRDKAVNLLEGARKRAPSLLGSKQIYTEPVKSGSATLHRARFAGFNGKNDARKACKILKKKKLSCLALNMG